MSESKRTVCEVIYHQYAKLIASAVLNVGYQSISDEALRKRYWELVRNRYSLLKEAKLLELAHWPASSQIVARLQMDEGGESGFD